MSEETPDTSSFFLLDDIAFYIIYPLERECQIVSLPMTSSFFYPVCTVILFELMAPVLKVCEGLKDSALSLVNCSC